MTQEHRKGVAADVDERGAEIRFDEATVKRASQPPAQVPWQPSRRSLLGGAALAGAGPHSRNGYYEAVALPEITNVLAEVLVVDHDAAVEWYTALFGREPDGRPMDGLAEWQLSPTGGLQVFKRAKGGGSSFTTVIVDTVAPVVEHLASIGVDTEMQTVSSGFAVASVRDPDGNTLTFAGSRAEG